MILDLDTYPSVGALVKEVESATEKGIEFLIQPLQGGQLGIQKTARGDVAHHLVIINESFKDIRHSIACFQMRLILGRALIKAPEKDITTKEAAVMEVFMSAQGKVGVEAARQLASMIVSGSVVQLMSVLPGIRAQQQIMKLQPDLALQHKRAMEILASNNLKNINPPNLPIPSKFVKWNKSLIAIENCCLSVFQGDTTGLIPLKALGLIQDAEKVTEPFLCGELDHLDNRELIDFAAKTLGMTSLYQWVKA